MDGEEYEKAQRILDTMKYKKISKRTDLSLIASVYTSNGRYEEALELIFEMYERTPTRQVVFQIIEIAIKKGDYKMANMFLKQYEKADPNDFYRLIFRYKIDKRTGKSFEELIETLEKLKKEEYIDKWAYELAKLYYKVGNDEKCKKECEDLILWFGEGIFVQKAKILTEYFDGEKDKTKIIESLKKQSEK